jgi:carnitine 3-dehydrogenase
MELKDIKKVSCVGGGVIGYSYALIMALKGLNVYIYDITDEALNLAKTRVHESLKPLINKDVVNETKAQEVEARIHYTKDMKEAVSDTYFIQESVPEHYEIKWKTMESIEKYAPDTAIIASSTSGLLITEIAKNAKHPERFVGGHPYNPPHLIPLVEITKGDKTTEANVIKAKEFYTLIGKEPVVLQKEALGFICNRLQMALYREVCELVMRGVCTIEDADKAVTFGPGIRWGIMGPSLIFELGGGKVGVDGLMNHLQGSINLWLNDMADFKEFPKDFPAIAKEGVIEEIKNRPKEIGNNEADLAKYRDDMLIEFLKLHQKL